LIGRFPRPRPLQTPGHPALVMTLSRQ